MPNNKLVKSLSPEEEEFQRKREELQVLEVGPRIQLERGTYGKEWI